MLSTCPECVNDIDIKGHTPLHVAVKMSNEHFVRMLLLNGDARTGVKGHRLKTPLHYAKLPSIVKILMENLSDNKDPYHKMYMKDAENDELYISMVDDQTGRKVTIPTGFLLGKNGLVS